MRRSIGHCEASLGDALGLFMVRLAINAHTSPVLNYIQIKIQLHTLMAVKGARDRRRSEVKEPKDSMSRSIYAVRLTFMHACLELTNGYQKGFGEEKPNTQKTLEEFFARFGNVNVVRMRRDDDKKWKVRMHTDDIR